ncbi:MAG: hypothetical protein JW963_09555 [Anaerolineales bacterium]|nr:hypothetical protein [Anaerolineales bacterium]
MTRKLNLAIHALVLIGILSACGLGNGSNNSAQDATLEAISAAVRGTATVGAAAKQNPNAPIETAQAEATARSQSVDATQAAQDALSEEARAATATAFAPYARNLPVYGVDPSKGRPGWIHPPVTLAIDGFLQYDFLNQFVATVAKDFVISSDITWNTQYGTSGCGFVLRSDGNKIALNQYMAIVTRGASGHVAFTTMSNGDVVSGRDLYAYGTDPNFNWGNNVTNRLTVVGRGLLFSIYSNDTLIGEVDPTAPVSLPGIPPAPNVPGGGGIAEQAAVATQITADYQARQREAANAEKAFERGFVALVVLSESGRSVCTFDNTWLWLIE